jgi:hypothetical protein
MHIFPPHIYPPQSNDIEIISYGKRGNSETRFRFLPNIQFKTIETIVLELPKDKRLGFYDEDYPSPSDPGTYFSVAHGKNGYIMSCGNHGWSSAWQNFEAVLIVQYLWGCRFSNMKPKEGGLYVSADNFLNRRMSEDKCSYFVENVSRRLESMSSQP